MRLNIGHRFTGVTLAALIAGCSSTRGGESSWRRAAPAQLSASPARRRWFGAMLLACRHPWSARPRRTRRC